MLAIRWHGRFMSPMIRFVTGFSNGGMFSWQAGSSLANRLAAVSPGGGQPFVGFVNPPNLAGGARISLMDIHGEKDVICPACEGV